MLILISFENVSFSSCFVFNYLLYQLSCTELKPSAANIIADTYVINKKKKKNKGERIWSIDLNKFRRTEFFHHVVKNKIFLLFHCQK